MECNLNFATQSMLNFRLHRVEVELHPNNGPHGPSLRWALASRHRNDTATYVHADCPPVCVGSLLCAGVIPRPIIPIVS